MSRLSNQHAWSPSTPERECKMCHLFNPMRAHTTLTARLEPVAGTEFDASSEYFKRSCVVAEPEAQADSPGSCDQTDAASPVSVQAAHFTS